MLLIAFQPFAIGQMDYFEISDLVKTMPCPYDTAQNITTYESWEVYQTNDDLPEGVRDSICFSIKNNNGFVVPKENQDKPIFIRWKKKDNEAIALFAHTMYNITYLLNADINGFKPNVNCDEDRCSNLKLKFKYFYNDGQSYSREDVIIGQLNHNNCILSDNFCLPSGKGDSITIEDVVFTIYLNASGQKDIVVGLERMLGFTYDDFQKIENDIIVNEYQSGDSIKLNLRDLPLGQSWRNNYLVTHDKAGVPSSTNADVKLLKLDPNPTEQKVISLRLFDDETLYFEDFTSLTAEKVKENDTLFHELEIVQDGGNLCLFLIDLRIAPGSAFRYIKGDIAFSDTKACMFFKEKSKLIVESDAQLNYGHHGSGMLGLSDAAIYLASDARMHFDGTLVLNSSKSNNHVYAAKNAVMVFGQNASIMCKGSGDEKIFFHGKADQLDVSALNAFGRDRFVIVEEVRQPDPTTTIYPNPTAEILFTQASMVGKTFSIYDLNGRKLLSSLVPDDGIRLNHLGSGLYIFSCIGKNTLLQIIK